MNNKTKKIVGIGLFTAIVVVLQLITSGLARAGMFSITFVLVPIVVGAAVYDWRAGAWLGFVFSALAMLDAGPFLSLDVLGTVVTVFAKGTLCGLIAGLVYKLLEKNQTVAVISAAVVCPLVNTGIFFLGCCVFFLPGLQQWALDFAALNNLPEMNIFTYIFTVLIGGNFFIELAMNLILVPVITRLIHLGRKS